MKFFKVTSLSDCMETVRKNLPSSVLSAVEKDIVDAEKCEDVYSPDCFPIYTRSTMDGFAVRCEDVYCCGANMPAFLRIVGKVEMGERPDFQINNGEAAAIATGGLMPDGANAVVMMENVDVLSDQIAVYSPVKMWENVVIRGEEIEKGDVIAKMGDVVSPLTVGVFASVGVEKVKVFDTVRVAVISTGDELVDIGERVENGKIRDVNSSLLRAILSARSYSVVFSTRIPDDEKMLDDALQKALLSADWIMISGGSSIGAKDMTERVLSKGEILLHGLALKPGKPTLIAKFGDKTVFGLPGNPFAAACVFQSVCDAAVRKARNEADEYIYAFAKTNFPSSPGRASLQAVRVEFDGEKYVAEPVFLKSAHLYSALKADGFAVLPESAEGIYAGDRLKIYPFIGKRML